MKEREGEGHPQERKGICLSLEGHGGFHPVSIQDKDKEWTRRSCPLLLISTEKGDRAIYGSVSSGDRNIKNYTVGSRNTLSRLYYYVSLCVRLD